jgi:hypothetical protein
MEGEDNIVQGFVGKPERKSHLEDLDVDGSMLLKVILKKCVGRA